MQRCLVRHNPEIQRDEENEDGRQSPRKHYEEAGQSQAEEAHRQWHNAGADECRGPSQNPEGLDQRPLEKLAVGKHRGQRSGNDCGPERNNTWSLAPELEPDQEPDEQEWCDVEEVPLMETAEPPT